jgi:hypothetical protein
LANIFWKFLAHFFGGISEFNGSDVSHVTAEHDECVMCDMRIRFMLPLLPLSYAPRRPPTLVKLLPRTP